MKWHVLPIAVVLALFGTFMLCYDIPETPYTNYIMKATFVGLTIISYAWLGYVK